MALARSYAQVIAGARQLSDTVNDPFVTDQEVLDRANDALAELYDLSVGVYEHLWIKSYDFTLTGGATLGLGVNEVALPADCQKVNGVDLNPDTASVQTVYSAPSFLERNQGSSRSAGGYGRFYMLVGSNLQIGPPQSAAGKYRLWYTPQAQYLVNPTPTLTTGDGISNTGVLTIQSATFDASYVGSTVTLANCVNPGNNGTWTIAAVLSSTVLQLTGGGFVNETFVIPGPTVTVLPLGGVSTVPQLFTPHVEYIITGAAIRIKDKKEQPADVLIARLATLKERAEAMFANRNEEPGQVPLTQRGSGFWDFPGQ